MIAACPAWLDAPWGGALLRFLADGANGADLAVLPGWPDGISADAALADPALRGALGRWLLPTSEADVAAVAAACDRPRVRLALAPISDLKALIALAAAWISAPALRRLLQRAEVDAARSLLGDQAWQFALNRARLLPHPTTDLLQVVGGEAVSKDLLRSGAAMLGLAIGAVPGPMLARLGLRRPAALWAQVCTSCHADAQGETAFAALRRLLREDAPPWSSWLH